MALPTDFLTLNDECLATNLGAEAKPFDHVFYQPPSSLRELGDDPFFRMIRAEMLAAWDGAPEDFPDSNLAFSILFSDHAPIVFNLITGDDD